MVVTRMGSKRTISKYNMEFYSQDIATKKYNMPIIYPTVYKPKRLVGFNLINTADSSAGIHFYLDDYQFERLWKRPEFYIEKLKRFDCVLTPDFSLYSDMPMPLMIWNVYRSRLIGQMMQQVGITVIPTVSWANEDTFEFCFDGLPQQSTLSVSTIGVKKNNRARNMWRSGISEMIKHLKPKQLLVYGGKVDFCYPKSVDIVYYENDNIKRLRGLANHGR